VSVSGDQRLPLEQMGLSCPAVAEELCTLRGEKCQSRLPAGVPGGLRCHSVLGTVSRVHTDSALVDACRSCSFCFVLVLETGSRYVPKTGLEMAMLLLSF
jgi:hypothetical protein